MVHADEDQKFLLKVNHVNIFLITIYYVYLTTSAHMKYLNFDFYISIILLKSSQHADYSTAYISLKLRKGWKDLVPSKWPGDSLVWEGLVCYLNRNWLLISEHQDGIYLHLHLHLSLICSFSSPFPFSFSWYVYTFSLCHSSKLIF